MADGFKKYFNGTTISGRANVAKATYATLALLYIIYRMRRGGSSKESQLASDTCSCDAEADPMPHGDTGIYGADPDCSVCRDRSERAMSEYDREQRRKAAAEDNGCRDDPPPPPPSSSSAAAGSAKPRAKCPCEDNQKRVNGALKTSNNNSSSSSSSSHARAWSHQLQPPNQYRQHFQQHGAAAPAEQESPVSELMGQVYDAVSRVVRGVVGAVLGGVAVNTTSGSSAGDARDQSFYEQDEDEDEEEDEVEEWREDRAYGSRNNPLFCTPTAHNASNGTPRPTNEGARVNYNAFSDGFASDMFFTSDAN